MGTIHRVLVTFLAFSFAHTFGYVHRLTSIAGCNQLGQKFYMLLPRLEAAKPKPTL